MTEPLGETVDELHEAFSKDMTVIEYVNSAPFPPRNLWAISTDADVERFYQTLLVMLKHPHQRWIEIGDERVVTRIQVGIAEGEIACDAILFMYDKRIIHANKYGALDNWPNGFADYNMNLCERLLLCQVERRKKDRDENSLSAVGD